MDGWAGSVPDIPHLDQAWPRASVSWLEQVVGMSQGSPGHEAGELPRVGDRVVVNIAGLSGPVSRAFWGQQSLPCSGPEPLPKPRGATLLFPDWPGAGRSGSPRVT